MGLFRSRTPQPHEHLLGRYEALKGLLRELHDELVSAIPPKTLLACARRRGVGAGVRDILRESRFFVMDKMIGKTVRPDLILAGTILDLPEFSVTTGAVLPFPEKVAGLLPGLRQKPGFSEGFRRSTAAIDPNDEALLALTLIVTSKETGLTERVRYENPYGDGGC